MTDRQIAWFRPLWLGLLIVGSAALTTGYTCITPFAAFAVIAATTLSRRDAVRRPRAWRSGSASARSAVH